MINVIAYMTIAFAFAVQAIMGFYDKKQLHETIDILTDKLMARDFSEYKDKTQATVNYEPVDNSEEAEYIRELEDMKQ